MQIIKIHLSTVHHNNYISQTCTFHPAITNKKLDYIPYIYNYKKFPNTIITADVNAHSPLWYLPTEDQRGELIEDILLNSDHITLNTNASPPNETQ